MDTKDPSTVVLLEQLAHRAAHEAVRSTLIGLGINHDNPLEAQRNMAALSDMRNLLEETDFQDDLRCIRKVRRAIETVESKGFVAMVTMICVSGIAIVGLALRYKIDI